MKRAIELMDVALEFNDAKRKAWLEELAVKEPDVAKQLEQLLVAHSRAAESGFLNQTITPQSISIPTEDDLKRAAPANMGPYRLIRQIGEGGMSTVWLAERDHESFTRQVAIKRLPVFLKGDGHERRLLREASILAKLNHPNIAKLLDAGVSETGDPYLALELIDGEPITSYCDRLRLDVKSRVALMATVAEAVAFLHQHSVIHRDIKPSNVLVDKAGCVKLLDFGIAKLVDDALPDSNVTRSSHNAFTPEYAAPEQIEGKPVTTATDVYSMGVLMYRVLTGTRPYGRTSAPLLVASAIVNTMPSRPSTLFGPAGDMPKDELAQITEARRSSVKQLYSNLRNDLDNILLKALEKEVARRYSSVDIFLADLRAYLASRPIQAKPASPFYIFRKFAQRHRGGVAISAIALAGMVIAIGFGAWQARQTQLQAQQTQLEVVKTKRVLTFLQTLIAEANPNNTGKQTITVLDLLQRAPEVAKKQFPNEPNLQYEVLKPVERILRDLENADALESVEREMVKLMPVLDKLPIEEEVELRNLYGLTLSYLRKPDLAEKEIEVALKKLEMQNATDTVAYAQTMMYKAIALSRNNRMDDAVKLANESHQRMVNKLGANDSHVTQSALSLIELLLGASRWGDAQAIGEKYFTLEQIGRVRSQKDRISFRGYYVSHKSILGDPIRAYQEYDMLLRETKDFFGVKSAVYQHLLQYAASTAISAGNYDEGINRYTEAEGLAKVAADDDKADLVEIMARASMAYLEIHRIKDAGDKIGQIDNLVARGAQATPSYWRAKFRYAMMQNDLPAAEKALDKRESKLPTSLPYGSLHQIALRFDRATAMLLRNETRKAIESNESAIADLQRVVPPDHYWIARARLQQAMCLMQFGESQEALKIASNATARIIGVLGETHPLSLQSRFILGVAEERAGLVVEGRKRAEEASRLYEARFNLPLKLRQLQLH